MRAAITAKTTSNSVRVNPERLEFFERWVDTAQKGV